jgi:hypothetical protein
MKDNWRNDAALVAFIIAMGGSVASAIAYDARGIYTFVKDWQGLIGSALTGLIAYVAIQPVRRQLDLLNRQSAIAARTLVLHKIEVYREEQAVLTDVRRTGFDAAATCDSVQQLPPRAQGRLHPAEIASNAAAALAEQHALLMKYIDSEPRQIDRSAKRREITEKILTFRLAVNGYVANVRRIFHSGVGEDEYEERRSAMLAAYTSLDDDATALFQDLNDAIRIEWIQADDLEHTARSKPV